MYAVTAATGQLGRLVVEGLLEKIPAAQIVAGARSPAKAADLARRGVAVREADYDRPDTLAAAFRGVDSLLLISSDSVGGRVAQHRAAIDAAKAAGVGFVVYTSLLHADRSPIALALDHRETEAALKASGLPHAVLRNGWYSENHLGALPGVLERGAVVGAAGDGRIASAARADYAAAAVEVLTGGTHAGRVYELAGDTAWTLSDLAAEIGGQSGRAVVYQNLAESAYEKALLQAGLPAAYARLLADADAGTANGALFDDGRALSRLIGRPTTPLSASVAAALAVSPAHIA